MNRFHFSAMILLALLLVCVCGFASKQTGLPHKMLWSSLVCLGCNGHCTLVAVLCKGTEQIKVL